MTIPKIKESPLSYTLRDCRQRLPKRLQEGFMGYLTAALEALKGLMSGHRILLQGSILTANDDLETHFGSLQSSIENMMGTGLPGTFRVEFPSVSNALWLHHL